MLPRAAPCRDVLCHAVPCRGQVLRDMEEARSLITYQREAYTHVMDETRDLADKLVSAVLCCVGVCRCEGLCAWCVLYCGVPYAVWRLGGGSVNRSMSLFVWVGWLGVGVCQRG